MGPRSYRLRACGRGIKSRKIDRCVGLGGLLQQGSGKTAFEAMKCKGPGAWLDRESLQGLLSCSGPAESSV